MPRPRRADVAPLRPCRASPFPLLCVPTDTRMIARHTLDGISPLGYVKGEYEGAQIEAAVSQAPWRRKVDQAPGTDSRGGCTRDESTRAPQCARQDPARGRRRCRDGPGEGE